MESKRTAMTLKGAALGLVAGGLMGGGIMACESSVYGYTQTPLEAKDDLADAEAELVIARQNLKDTHKSIGEACLAVINPYVGEGPLANGRTSEDVIVSDLLAEPSQPCGETPRQVRLNYYELEDAIEGLDSAEDSVYWSENKLDDAEEHPPATAKDWAAVTLIFGAIGMGMGNWIGRNSASPYNGAQDAVFED